MRRAMLICGLVVVACLTWDVGVAIAAIPPIKHVFILWLENENYDSTFGQETKIPYLARDLRNQGALLEQYHATGHLSLDNYLTVVSGQPPNPYTQADAPAFTDFIGTVGSDGVAIGQGTVFPPEVKTIADQLEEKGLTWKGYMEDMQTPCRHPAPGAVDDTQDARVGDQYATRHNPFVYFHSIIDRPTCVANDVPLERLPADLQSKTTTASYSFITPNLCNDGHDEPCVDGRPGGMESANEFLKVWVPRITSSLAYRDGGMLVVSFDEAEALPNHEGDASGCCGEPIGPNTPNNGGPIPGNGGGRIGAVVLSPYIRPGTVSSVPYNHYSMLRTTEDIFGLDHLAYAARPELKAFGDDVFTAQAGAGEGLVGPPTIRVRGVPKHGCTSGFRARVRIKATRLKRVRARVDRHVVFRKRSKRFRVRVRASRLHPGVHRLRVRVTQRGGAPGHAVRHFRTC